MAQRKTKTPKITHTAWDDFRYIKRNDGTADPRPTAARIKALLESPGISHNTVRELEIGVCIMMLCAGRLPSRTVPIHLQYLSAFQLVSDYHAGLIFSTPEEVDRVLALCRAEKLVVDAIKKSAEVRANGRMK
jgi:hypothetical protein